MRFDGREFAKEMEATLRQRLRSGMRVPKIVSVLVGNDPASELYTRLKQEAASRVGISFSIEKLDLGFKIQDLKRKIAEIGDREDVTGLMVQMPLPDLSREEQREVIRAIPLDKDVDGLRWEESGVMPATVRAIMSIIEKIERDAGFKIQDLRVVVIGTHGSVGRPLVYYLKECGVGELIEVNSDTKEPARTILAGEVVISCVGREGLITKDMVSSGSIVIDVGAPKGDMTDEVYDKAGVAVGVPGGVGPVTVISLMESVVRIVDATD